MYDLYDYGAMLGYPARVAKFIAALEASRPAGAVVCEIGTGFGFFAILAAWLGARRVYAIEPNEAVGFGPRLAEDNGVAEKIEFIRGMSTEVELPELADIVVSDMRSSMPFYGAHIRSIRDARQRLLKPGGRLIPARDALYCAISTHAGLHDRTVAPWKGAVPGTVELERISDELARRPSRATFFPNDLLPDYQLLGELDYAAVEGEDFAVSRSWRLAAGGRGYGLCLWFDSELAPGISLSGTPGQPRLPYGQLYLPWRNPLKLEAGQAIGLEVSARLEDGDYRWDWQIEAGGPATAGSDLLPPPAAAASAAAASAAAGTCASRPFYVL